MKLNKRKNIKRYCLKPTTEVVASGIFMSMGRHQLKAVGLGGQASVS